MGMNSIMQKNGRKKNYVTVGDSVADIPVDAVVEAGVELVDGGAEGICDNIGDAVADMLNGVDELPALAVVGIIAGVIAVVGGIAFGLCKIFKAVSK